MPEIDNDLFKVLVIALLAISTLLLLALLSALSGVRKLLKQQLDRTGDLRDEIARGGLTAAPASQTSPEGPVTEAPQSAAAAPLVGGAAAADLGPSEPTPAASRPAEPVAWEPEDERPPAGADVGDSPASREPFPAPTSDDAFATSEPSSSSAEDLFAAAPSGADPFAPSSPGDDPFAAPSTADEAAAPSGADEAAAPTTADEFASTSGGDPFATTAPGDERTGADEPFAASAATADEENPFITGATEEPASQTPASQATFDEPEDQPFERNGRWFFRRDNELLVYQEGTGEWVPADPADLEPPAPAAPQAPAPAATSGSTDLGADTGDTARFETVEEEPRPTAGGGFWKCPSCGAVNGSSATTCRMCFSARP